MATLLMWMFLFVTLISIGKLVLDVQKMKEEIHNRIVQLTVDIEVDCDYSLNPVVQLDSFIREKDDIALEMKVFDKFGANEEEMNELKYLFGGISMSLERLISI